MTKSELETLRDETVAAAVRLNELAAAYNSELCSLHPLRRFSGPQQTQSGAWFAARVDWPGVDDIYRQTKKEIDYAFAIASGLGKLTVDERKALYPEAEAVGGPAGSTDEAERIGNALRKGL